MSTRSDYLSVVRPVSSGQESILTTLWTLVKAPVTRGIKLWRARRIVRRLDRLSPHLLQDIGLEPSDLSDAQRLPYHINGTSFLADVAKARSVKRKLHR